MGKYFSLITAFLFFSYTAFGQFHGLQFSSHEVVPEKRTSLNLTASGPLCLSSNTELSFDLNFTPNLETYFGYVIRLITTNNQNIDIVYNQRLRNFNFVIGETFSSVFNIDSAKLFGEWNHFEIRFNNKSREVIFYLNNRLICKGGLNFNNNTCCQVYFGINDLEGFKIIDVPPMRIKDIRIKQDKKEKYYYPLSEASGDQAIDVIEKKVATAKNPVWIQPKHRNWKRVHSFKTKATASIAFDKNSEILYVTSVDSLYQVSFKNDELNGSRLLHSRVSLPAGNQSVFDHTGEKLYNFYIDEKKVSTYQPLLNTWDVNFTSNSLTEFWQANKFFSPFDTSLYVIAGYGQLQYKNLVQRYRFSDKKWETLAPGGDFFMPRYLAALGTNTARDTAYILGGFGSNTGDQTINPKYNYELLAYSVKSNSFKRIYQLNQPAKEFCFANSLIIDSATSDLYSLIYPIDRFNSSLQLIRGSLRSPEYELVGDSIPYLFHDIESFADLYYCPASKKLVAVTLFSSKDSLTSVNIFTLDFPPNPAVFSTEPNKKSGVWTYVLLVTAIAAVLVFFLILKIRKPKRRIGEVNNQSVPQTQQIETPPAVPQTVIAVSEAIEKTQEISAIFLFGQFEVIDKNGNDITKQFTPLVKELFLLILIYTLKDGKGISSEQLYETLWHDKSIKDARNNYSVNIVKLKTILEKIGESTIAKDTGKWRLEILNGSITVDYQKFIDLKSKGTITNKDHIIDLFNIVNRGAFLREAQYNWLDDIKSDVTNFVIDTFLKYISAANISAEAEFIVKLTNTIFFFDQLNEEALEYKCRSLVLIGRHGMAKDAYVKFAKEYRENYGQEFERSFTDMVGHL